LLTKTVSLNSYVFVSSPFRGKDMDVLYKTIMKGSYAPIPGIYSNDLAMIIK